MHKSSICEANFEMITNGGFADGIYHQRLSLGCEMNYERFLGNFRTSLLSRQDREEEEGESFRETLLISRSATGDLLSLANSSYRAQMIIINDIPLRFVNVSNNSRRRRPGI